MNNKIHHLVPPTDKQLVPPTNKIKQLVPPTNKNHQVNLPTNKPQHLRRRHSQCSRLSSLSLSFRRLHLRRRHTQCSRLSSLSLSSRQLQLRRRHSQCSRLPSLSLSSRRLQLRRRHSQCSRLSSLSLSFRRLHLRRCHPQCSRLSSLSLSPVAPTTIVPRPTYEPTNAPTYVPAPLRVTANAPASICPEHAPESLRVAIPTISTFAAPDASFATRQSGTITKTIKTQLAAHQQALRSAYLHEPKPTSTNYCQCLAKDDSPNLVAPTAPKAASTDEGVCASLRHINPSAVSMGEGVLIPVRNPDITDRYKPASLAVTAGIANCHSSATRQTRRRASKRSHRQQTSS